MQFINVKRFSPVVHEGDLPDPDDYFHKSPESISEEFLQSGSYYIDEDWWHRQRDRCLHGYEVKNAIAPGGDMFIDGVGCTWHGKDCYVPLYDMVFREGMVWISGRHYFYLNFWPIYGVKEGSVSKGLTTPMFLGNDYWFYQRIEMMMKRQQDGQELKGRQLGFSEKGAGGVIGYNYTFFADSINLIIGGISDDADHTMERCVEGLDNLSNTQFFKKRKRGGDRKDYIKAKDFGSEVRSLTAKDNPQTASRFSPFWCWFEEIGKGKKGWSLDVAKYIRPSVVTLGRKTGWSHYIGTAGEMDEGIHDLEERHYKPEKYGILAFENIFEKERSDVKVGHFTGKQWFRLIDDNGNPLIQKSIDAILSDRAKLTTEDRYRAITQEPIYASEAFLTSEVGFFGEHAVQLLNSRKQLVQNNKDYQIVKRGYLTWKNKAKPFEGVEFHSDEDYGWLKVVQEPIVDDDGRPIVNLYKAGVDSYDQDEANTTNSKGAMFVKKTFYPKVQDPFYNMHVAQVVERPKPEKGGAPKFYEHCAMLAIWYGCQMNIEYSNLRIFEWLETNGFESLLKERPRIALAGKVMHTQVSNRYGTDRSLKPHILANLADELTEDYISRMFFLEQIRALSTYRYDRSGKKYNCDITIATAETEIAAKEDELLPVKSRSEFYNRKKEQGRGYRAYKRQSDGSLVSQKI